MRYDHTALRTAEIKKIDYDKDVEELECLRTTGRNAKCKMAPCFAKTAF